MLSRFLRSLFSQEPGDEAVDEIGLEGSKVDLGVRRCGALPAAVSSQKWLQVVLWCALKAFE